jgi:pimeloyl-ACP methyl ester carboxylesterase
LALAGCAGPAATESVASAEHLGTAELRWADCEGESTPADLECAELDVPADWGDPGGERITLRLARAAATGGDRTGTVLFNPGGPGGSGTAALARSLDTFSGLREHMDVVTWDPRGGQGTSDLPPDTCHTGPALGTPDDEAEYDAIVRASEAARDACREASPVLFDTMDSASTARDMDAIRVALGEEEVNYFGNSYGGVLGASYARLFPDRVRTMYLDSVPDHTSDLAGSDRLQYEGMEAAFARFVDWCADAAECEQGGDAGQAWLDLVAAAERDPVAGADPDLRYDGDDLKLLAYPMLIRRAAWPGFSAAIAEAAAGDASLFDPEGRGHTPQINAMLATRCGDGFLHDGYDAYTAAVERSREVSPHFWGVRENFALACGDWPIPVANPPAPLPADDLPPFLGAGPLLEHPSVAAVTAQVPGSVTIGYDATGHGLYVNEANACVIAHADRYLVEGTLPPEGTACPPGDD